MRDQLKEQNNGSSWRDCEAAGLAHRLGPVVELRADFTARSTVRRCTRCPVSIMNIERR